MRTEYKTMSTQFILNGKGHERNCFRVFVYCGSILWIAVLIVFR